MRMTLAQGDTSILGWSLVLMGLVVVGFLLVSWVRNRLRQPEEPASHDFSLGELRALHRQGQLSDQEYERARQRLIGNIRHDPHGKL
jgi:hypothetical protein